LYLFGQVNEQKLSDGISINAALSAIASAGMASGMWQAALHLICGMPASRLVADLVTQNSGINAVKSDAWEMALHLFRHGDVTKQT
jgi:hypothetical protein